MGGATAVDMLRLNSQLGQDLQVVVRFDGAVDGSDYRLDRAGCSGSEIHKSAITSGGSRVEGRELFFSGKAPTLEGENGAQTNNERQRSSIDRPGNACNQRAEGRG